MLHAYDQYSNIEWEHIDPDAVEDNGEPAAEPPVPPNMSSGLALIPATSGARVVPMDINRHDLLELALQRHFQYCFARGHVVWPRGFSHLTRALFPPISLLNTDFSCLYKAQSWCRRRNPDTGRYTEPIGYGLFTSIEIPAGTKLCRFYGNETTQEEYELADAEGRRGYAIKFNANLVLDCYEYRVDCLASMANCASGVRSVHSGRPTVVNNNCRLSLRAAYLVAEVVIPKHRELLWDYGPDYLYPDL